MKNDQQSVNQRILMLKNDMKMTHLEFCDACKIASGTLRNIQNGKEISRKVIKSISSNLNIYEDWLQTGKGEIFMPLTDKKNTVESTPWRDEAYQSMKDQVEFLKEIIRANGLNFLQPVRETA